MLLTASSSRRWYQQGDYRNITLTYGRGWTRWVVADTSAPRSGLGRVTNAGQATQGPMENKEVRRGRNHNQWKRGIVVGHVGVIDYISSRILAKVSCSLALPTPDDSFVWVNSLIALLLHTSIIVKNKNITLYFYFYVFLVVHQDTPVIYKSYPPNIAEAIVYSPSLWDSKCHRNPWNASDCFSTILHESSIRFCVA